jgi:hypothetical protein
MILQVLRLSPLYDSWSFSADDVLHNIEHFRSPKACASETPAYTDSPYRILRIDLSVERSLEVSMRAQTLFNISAPPSLRPQLQSFEPIDVF